MAKNRVAEEWRPIPGYEGHYEASSAGRIRTAKAYRNTFIGRILPGTKNPRGYLVVTLHRLGVRKVEPVHKLVARTFCGDNSGQHTHHKNEIKTDNRPENLQIIDGASHASVHHSVYPKERTCPVCFTVFVPDKDHRGRNRCCGIPCRGALIGMIRRGILSTHSKKTQQTTAL